MAFTNQFSLSLELTKFLPGSSLVNLAGRGLIHLMRELQNSGSDFITEGDLAEIFGRNRIDNKFASTFRTAVKHSAIHQIADIAELVIEAGAGPTVRRSLKEPAYFSTVIQLSLLTWAHDLSTLARSLAQVLERRAKDAETPATPPTYDALKGTLRACREQTSGFMWELFFAAVEKKLETTSVGDDKPFDARPIPIPVLQSLLDFFTAVQHLPDTTLIRIKSHRGISTVVVWAHCVLGLTVLVESTEGTVRFGEGSESVYVELRGTVAVEASLYNETQDLLFNVVESNQDTVLEPVCRHPILGYGLRVIELTLNDDNLLSQEIIHSIVTSCIRLVQDQNAERAFTNIGRPGKIFCPSVRQVIAVATMLFPNHYEIFDELDLDTEQPCLARSDWQADLLPPAITRYRQPISCRVLVLRLAHVLFILSMVENIEDCEGLPLELFPDSEYSRDEGNQGEGHSLFGRLEQDRRRPFRIPDAHKAFNTLVALLQGRNSQFHDGDGVRNDDKAAVISAWGWSICLSSLACRDPSEIRAGFTVLKGVPTRNGVRKRLILDGFMAFGSGPQAREAERKRMQHSNDNKIIAQPGDTTLISSSETIERKTQNLIAVTDTAFEVARVYTFKPLKSEVAVRASHSETKSEKLGFRAMQDIYWRVVHLPICEHTVHVGQTLTLPQGAWAFKGFDEPLPTRTIDDTSSERQLADWETSPEGSVHVGLVAGDSTARWTLSNSMLNRWWLLKSKSASNSTVFLRSAHCCFECAISITKSQREAQNVGLVL